MEASTTYANNGFPDKTLRLTINSCEKIYDKAHPDGILQERKINFSEYYSFIGKKMIKNIYDSIIPFDNKLIVIEI